MTLKGYPNLMTKTQLGEVFGISIWAVNRRLASGWGKNWEWVNDNGQMKVSRDSVESDLNKNIIQTKKDMTPPPCVLNGRDL